MRLEEYFPIWNKLTKEQQNRLSQAVFSKSFDKGTLIHNGSLDCQGLLMVKSGQLRAFISSETGEGGRDSNLVSLSLGAPKPASKLCFSTGWYLIGAELASLDLSVLM